MLKTKNKEKILQADRGKDILIKRMTIEFLSQTKKARRQWNGIKVLKRKKKNFEIRIIYSEKKSKMKKMGWFFERQSNKTHTRRN